MFSRTLTIIAFISMSLPAFAQYESPVAYMDYLSSIEADLAKNYMIYMSAMAHSGNARKLERKRAEVITSIKEGKNKVRQLNAFNGETSLRQAYNKYLDILEAVLTEDYGRIVNMEEIAEQSYDKMEAYLLAQQQAREKLSVATDSLRSSYRGFAAKNNVKLITTENKISIKLAQTAAVMSYYNQVFLINFKATKQEAYTIRALNLGDVNGVEQNKSTLSGYAAEGLEKLKAIRPFENDNSLLTACANLLVFQKTEADVKISGLTDFLIKQDEFSRFKKEYDAKPVSARERSDTEDYNSFVTDMNRMSDNYNKTNDLLNADRKRLNDAWEKAVDKFLDQHVPK